MCRAEPRLFWRRHRSLTQKAQTFGGNKRPDLDDTDKPENENADKSKLSSCNWIIGSEEKPNMPLMFKNPNVILGIKDI